MESYYVYTQVLNNVDRNSITLELMSGKTFKFVARKYGLTPAFIKNNLWQDILNIHSVSLGNKDESYYPDEMSYGTIPSYNFDDFDHNEKSVLNTPMPDK